MHGYCNKIAHCNGKKIGCSALKDEMLCACGVMFLALNVVLDDRSFHYLIPNQAAR